VICGADTWNEMELYAKEKEKFLRTILDLPNGIPSHDTFNRVFSSIDSSQFETCFIEWVKSISELIPKEIIAIDGKTIRGAKSNGKKSPIHMVSAFASANNLVLGQTKTNEKSNEITSIPKLLELLSIEGSIITIDAMGCQTAIATKIVEKKADYILAVKANQKQLYEDLAFEFKIKNLPESVTNVDFGHGRIETRKCSILTNLKHIENINAWQEAKTIIKIESIREFKNSDKKIEKSTRYYLSSLLSDPKLFRKLFDHIGVLKITFIGCLM
jgi:predicted transposase YbfD/YdcC